MKKSNDSVEGEWHYRKINPTGPGYAADRLQVGPDIDGLPGVIGSLVFQHGSRAPVWICEWQPDNGHVFDVVDAQGNHTLTGPEQLTRNHRNV